MAEIRTEWGTPLTTDAAGMLRMVVRCLGDKLGVADTEFLERAMQAYGNAARREAFEEAAAYLSGVADTTGARYLYQLADRIRAFADESNIQTVGK